MNQQQRKRFAEALDRVAGDEETLTVVASLVGEDAPPLLEEFRNAIDDGELPKAARIGHTLKGMLSGFETHYPVDEIQAIIDAARVNDAKVTKAKFNEIDLDLQGLLSEIIAISAIASERG